MDGFHPETSFGPDVAQRYDDDLRGDEEASAVFLARHAGEGVLEFAIGTGRVALPLAKHGCALTASNSLRTWWQGSGRSRVAPTSTCVSVTWRRRPPARPIRSCTWCSSRVTDAAVMRSWRRHGAHLVSAHLAVRDGPDGSACWVASRREVGRLERRAVHLFESLPRERLRPGRARCGDRSKPSPDDLSSAR
jgi:hypothetical protein